MPSLIEDYALIGDCETAALVARDGSIDWLCWPRFDSGACFAALLGGPEHGRWKVAPVDPSARATRRYRGDTMILETDFETAEGAVTVIDFMPLRGNASDLVRTVVGRRGRVAMQTELVFRFDYGSIVPWVSRLEEIVTPSVVVAYPDEPLRAIAYRMASTGLTRFPVVERGDDRTLIGMISLTDLLHGRTRTLDAERRRERILSLRIAVAAAKERS